MNGRGVESQHPRHRHGALRRAAAAVILMIAAAAVTACGLQVPSDPDGALERITHGTLRVGASPSGSLVVVDPDGGVEGTLADLIEGFAQERDARIEWAVDSEEDLVDDLESGELDLAIGGMTDKTPWIDRVSATRGYPDVPGADGASVVVLLPLGENALQAALETYLDAELSR